MGTGTYFLNNKLEPGTKFLNSFLFILSVDPTNDDRIAGHSESQVVIWDRRNFEKPIVTINTMQQVPRGALLNTVGTVLVGTSADEDRDPG